jgi:hypothetical protein
MRNSKNEGGPAFPRHDSYEMKDEVGQPGMTMLQWYSGQALAGIMANGNLSALHNMAIEAGEMSPGDVRRHLADMAWLMGQQMITGEDDDTERESDRALRMGEVSGYDADGSDGGGDGKEVADAPDVGECSKGGRAQDHGGPSSGG